jgi:carbon storage regulator CsrA
MGDDIEVVVLGFQGDRIRLGIAAPDEVVVLRSEL